MKLTDRKAMIREVFNDLELSEIRAALSDRYDTLVKMAEKEEKHGRRYDDRSWPRERLAILDGDGLRAGVINVFDPRSPEATNEDLFEGESEEPSGPVAPEPTNEPAAEDEELADPGADAPGVPGDDEVIEADYEIVDVTPEEFYDASYIRDLIGLAGPDGIVLPTLEGIEDWAIADRQAVVAYATAVHLGESDFAAEIPPMPEVLRSYLADQVHAEELPPPTLADLDALTLEELGTPTRARNTLARHGITTAAEYIGAGIAVLRIPGIGSITLNEINQALRDRGLTQERVREIEREMEALARELEAARAQSVARIVATARAGGVAEAPAVALPDSVTAEIQDGLLTAHVTYHPSLGVVRLPWSVTVPLEQILAVGPDRRLVAFARSRDSRVEVSIDTLHYTLPEPERRGSPVRCAVAAGAAGAINGGLLARRERPHWAALGIGSVVALIACR